MRVDSLSRSLGPLLVKPVIVGHEGITGSVLPLLTTLDMGRQSFPFLERFHLMVGYLHLYLLAYQLIGRMVSKSSLLLVSGGLGDRRNFV